MDAGAAGNLVRQFGNASARFSRIEGTSFCDPGWYGVACDKDVVKHTVATGLFTK
jgi:hypothetical protein